MWKATLISKELIDNKLRVVVILQKGKDKFEKDFYVESLNANLDWLKEQINKETNRIDSLGEFKDTLELGEIDL